jgi:uncharacterized membrane protein YfcA
MLTWLDIALFIRGDSGFGFSAMLVAGLAFVVEPLAAVPLAIAFEVAASIVQGRSIRHEIRWKDFWTLRVAAIIGNPLGVLILTTVDGDRLRGATFGVLFVLSLMLLFKRTARLEPTTDLVFGVGVVASVVDGVTAMSGLVVGAGDVVHRDLCRRDASNARCLFFRLRSGRPRGPRRAWKTPG